MKALVLKESYFFKPGQIVEFKEEQKRGVHIDEHFLCKDSYIVLTETLNAQDEKKVRDMIKDVLRKLFWRIYTRQNFLTS